MSKKMIIIVYCYHHHHPTLPLGVYEMHGIMTMCTIGPIGSHSQHQVLMVQQQVTPHEKDPSFSVNQKVIECRGCRVMTNDYCHLTQGHVLKITTEYTKGEMNCFAIYSSVFTYFIM